MYHMKYHQLIMQENKQQTKSHRCTKWTTYILTFMAYLSIHTMRMSYSQVKSQFQSDYNQSNLFLGILDSLVYISLGIGFFLRFLIIGNMNLVLSYALFVGIAAIAYLIIPVSSLVFGDLVQHSTLLKQVLPSIGLLIFGFCQFTAWPTLLTLTSERFDHTKEGKAMGIWSANGNLGNITGFAMTGLLVDVLQLKWEFAMIAAAGFNFFMILLVVIFVRQKHEHGNMPLEDQISSIESSEQKIEEQLLGKKESKFKKFLYFSKRIISKTQNKLYLLSMGLLKSILYGFLLWMPTYLAHIDLSTYKAVLPIVFDSGTLVGSFTLGQFYNHNIREEGICNAILTNLKHFSLFYCCLGTTTLLLIFYLIEVNIGIYIAISAFCGAFLGGAFNMMASNEVISIVGGKKEDVNMLSTLSMVVGNLMVGLLQIIIGVTLNLKRTQGSDQSLFLILVVVGLITICVLFWRSRILSSLKSSLKGQILLSLVSIPDSNE